VWSGTYPVDPPACTNTLQGTDAGVPSAAETGYWGNLLPAIAYAVDHGATGASAAWARLTGADNWSIVENSGFDNIPIWGIIPRESAQQNPTLAAIASNNALDLGAYPSYTPPGGINENTITDYSGFVYDSTHGCMLMMGGGHSATFANYVMRLDVTMGSNLQWTKDYERTPRSLMTTANLHWQGYWISDGLPITTHTYDLLSWNPAAKRLIYLRGHSPLGDNISSETLNMSVVTDPRAWEYDPATKTWTKGGSISFQHDASEHDPISGLTLIVSNTIGIWTYDPTTHTATQRKTGTIDGLSYAQNLVYCPKNDKFYWIRIGSPVRVFEIALDRSTWANSTVTEVTGMTGTPDVTNETGWAYDTVNNIIGGGVQAGHFFAYDPVTKIWTDRTMVPSAGNVGSVAFHALAFDALNGVFIFITNAASGRHTWAYRY
jgi:hypothetical protein